MNPDELAELEEERRFLLRSLTDLDREHDAGDVDADDYAVLRDGYTARAATVLRSIEEQTAALPPARARSRRALAVWVVGIIAIAALSGWLVARSSGQRLSGQTITGAQTIDDVPAKLSEARAALGNGAAAESVQLFQEVLALDPDNAEARTYIAWLLALSSRDASEATATLALDQAKASFEAVIADEPGYADAHCLYAVMAANLLPEPDVDLAKAQGGLCLANNPPADMRGLIEAFVADL